MLKLSVSWSTESTTAPRPRSSRWHRFTAAVVARGPPLCSQPQAVQAGFPLDGGVGSGIQMNRGFKVRILAAISSHPVSHHHQGEPLIPVCGCGREVRSLGSPRETWEDWGGILVTPFGLFLLGLFLSGLCPNNVIEAGPPGNAGGPWVPVELLGVGSGSPDARDERAEPPCSALWSHRSIPEGSTPRFPAGFRKGDTLQAGALQC